MKILHNVLNKFTWVLVVVLAVVLVYSTLEFIIVLGKTIANRTEIFDFSKSTFKVDSLFLIHVHGFIAGVLMLTIIIELMHTLLATLDHEKKANIIAILLEIGLIAVIRHLFVIELDHIKGINVIGIAILILVLGTLMLAFSRGSSLLSVFNAKNKDKISEENEE